MSASPDPVVTRRMWEDLHLRPRFVKDWDREAEWVLWWLDKLGCALCKGESEAWIRQNPPTFRTAPEYFAWGVRFHNFVNAKLLNPIWSVGQAAEYWSKPRMEITTMIVPEKETPIPDGPEQYGYAVQVSYAIRSRPRKPGEPDQKEITLEGSVSLQRLRAMKDGSNPQPTTSPPMQVALKGAAPKSPEAEFIAGLEELIGNLAKAKGA